MSLSSLLSSLLPEPYLFIRILFLTLLASFMPLTAYTYYCFRRSRGQAEDIRIMNLLDVSPELRASYGLPPGSRSDHRKKPLDLEWFFLFVAVSYVTLLTFLGLSVLFLSPELGLKKIEVDLVFQFCLLYTSPSPRDATLSRMPSSA